MKYFLIFSLIFWPKASSATFIEDSVFNCFIVDWNIEERSSCHKTQKSTELGLFSLHKGAIEKMVIQE